MYRSPLALSDGARQRAVGVDESSGRTIDFCRASDREPQCTFENLGPPHIIGRSLKAIPAMPVSVYVGVRLRGIVRGRD